jgi:hypothetical protein
MMISRRSRLVPAVGSRDGQSPPRRRDRPFGPRQSCEPCRAVTSTLRGVRSKEEAERIEERLWGTKVSQSYWTTRTSASSCVAEKLVMISMATRRASVGSPASGTASSTERPESTVSVGPPASDRIGAELLDLADHLEASAIDSVGRVFWSRRGRARARTCSRSGRGTRRTTALTRSARWAQTESSAIPRRRADGPRRATWQATRGSE